MLNQLVDHNLETFVNAFFDFRSFKAEKNFTKMNNPSMSDLIAFTSDEKLMCIAGPNKDLSFIEVPNEFRELPSIRDAHESNVSAVIFSQDGS